jgi:hypothetical protein
MGRLKQMHKADKGAVLFQGLGVQCSNKWLARPLSRLVPHNRFGWYGVGVSGRCDGGVRVKAQAS